MISTKMLERQLSRHRNEIQDCVSMSIRSEDYKDICTKALASLEQTINIVKQFIKQEES